MKMFLLFVMAMVVSIVLAVTGVDVSQPLSAATFHCIMNTHVSFAIIRGYCSYGGLDSHAVASLTAAKSVGLITDIYMFPCRSKSATAQVNEMMAGIPNNLFGMVWLDIETNPSTGCSWAGHDAASNCAFTQELISAIKAKGKNPGLYSSLYMWETIFGSRSACPSVASQQLWYAHYDGSPSFDDFSSFGGWTKPNIKQYKGDTTLCGAGVDLNFYP
jgi:GH25 family lysozyme M1 (1,4-beta-N-acetylmuramidase)